jgi:uncharacterized protein
MESQNRRAARERMFTLAAITAGAYVALVALVFVFQDRLLYLPNIEGSGLTATPAAIGLYFEDVRLRTPDGVSLHGWMVPYPGSDRLVLHFHGNGGNISHRLYLIRLLHSLRLSVMLIDYRGYGLSEGRPSEAGTYLDAMAAWDYLTRQRGYPPRHIVVFGHSLGAAIAAQLAQHVQPGALILESPFISLPEVAGHHYWFLPTRWLARFKYATAEYVRRVTAPVLVLHSVSDRVVPYRHGREVYRNAHEPKAFVEIQGDHNEGCVIDEAQYTSGLREFLIKVASQ